MGTTGATIATALGRLLQRGVRSGLYAQVVEGVHPAVTSVNYPVLSGLERYGPSTASALGAELGVDRSFVSRLGSHLAESGLVTGTTSREDARAVELSLTDEGERVVAVLRTRLEAAVDDRLASWSSADRRRLGDLLDRFAAALADDPDTHGPPTPREDRP